MDACMLSSSTMKMLFTSFIETGFCEFSKIKKFPNLSVEAYSYSHLLQKCFNAAQLLGMLFQLDHGGLTEAVELAHQGRELVHVALFAGHRLDALHHFFPAFHAHVDDLWFQGMRGGAYARVVLLGKLFVHARQLLRAGLQEEV